MEIFQIKILNEIDFFLVIIHILIQFQKCSYISPNNFYWSIDPSPHNALQLTTFLFELKRNNTDGSQWSLTLCFDEVGTSQHIRSVYYFLNCVFIYMEPCDNTLRVLSLFKRCPSTTFRQHILHLSMSQVPSRIKTINSCAVMCAQSPISNDT